MVTRPEQARILIVSPSHYTRYVISGELSDEPDLFVVGTARTSDEISYKQKMLRPHLAVVDLESPHDLSDLRQSLPGMHLPVLALCAHTEGGAELAFAALEAGVADVIAKRKTTLGAADFVPDLLTKVRGLARMKSHHTNWHWPNYPPRPKASPRAFFPGDRLIVVSASTGGIIPLVQLLTALPEDLEASLLVLPSLPTYYLYLLIQRVSPLTSFCLRQARDGLPLQSGVAYFVPQDHHLATGARGRLILNSVRDHDGVSPLVDATMSSLASHYGPAVIAVILSGIGQNGVQGVLDVCAAGGSVIVQETGTCLADETPAAIIASGANTTALPTEQIADELVRRVSAKT